MLRAMNLCGENKSLGARACVCGVIPTGPFTTHTHGGGKTSGYGCFSSPHVSSLISLHARGSNILTRQVRLRRQEKTKIRTVS